MTGPRYVLVGLPCTGAPMVLLSSGRAADKFESCCVNGKCRVVRYVKTTRPKTWRSR